MTGFRSHLGRARGAGSSGGATHHWVMQRLTAVSLIPLAVWFIYSAVALTAGDLTRDVIVAWFGDPFNAIVMILLLTAMFWHGSLGIQVVIEDYIHVKRQKLVLLIVSKLACFGMGVAGIFAIISMHIKGLM